jgi:hypothetical protein
MGGLVDWWIGGTKWKLAVQAVQSAKGEWPICGLTNGELMDNGVIG